ncbi:MAG TPA: phage portal protein, partial [Phycisphaerae bacterium]|nr:phage portal protein [Phycisphaerae bacterium]
GYVVGSGFKLQVKPSQGDWHKAVEKKWRKFWKRPEVRQLLSGPRVERMVCRELYTCGDVGLLKLKTGLLQLVESEQITGPKAGDDGIGRNETGTPTMFHVGSYGPAGYVPRGKTTPYKPEDVLFIAEPDRPSSTRGYPPCQAAFPMIHRITDVCDSEALAWQLLARLPFSVIREQGSSLAFNESVADPNKTASDTQDIARRLIELDYAIIFEGLPGEKIEAIDRNIPGQNFSEALYTFLRLLGLPLGLPLEIVLLDWTKSNYSQSRAVLEQAYQTFLGWQMLIEDFFLRPVFEWQLARWIAAKSLPAAPQDFDPETDVEWIKPTFPWIDQLKEAQAYGEQLDRGLATHAQVCKSKGGDRDEIVERRVAEVTDAVNHAKKIKADTGVTVPWQLFAGVKLPGTSGAAKPLADQDVDDSNTKEEGGQEK